MPFVPTPPPWLYKQTGRKIPRRIVAEVSTNWRRDTTSPENILAARFEHVISVNRERGYELESWRFSQIEVEEWTLTETIIAVFVEAGGPSAPEATARKEGES